MDFHSLARKELQALCKKNKIPANITNVAMADALQALEKVEGLDEFITASKSEFPEKTTNAEPKTAVRSSTRRNPSNVEPQTSQVVTRTRRTTRQNTVEEAGEENKNVNVLVTPTMPTAQRRVTAASVRRKIDALLEEEKESASEEKIGAPPETPAIQSTRRKATAVSTRKAKKDEKSVLKAYSTRHSVRLLEKSLEDLSLKEAVKIEGLSEDESEQVEVKKDVPEDDCQIEESLENDGEMEHEVHVENNTSDDSKVADKGKPELSSESCNIVDIHSGLDAEDSVEPLHMQIETSESAAEKMEKTIQDNDAEIIDSDTVTAALDPETEKEEIDIAIEISETVPAALEAEIEKEEVRIAIENSETVPAALEAEIKKQEVDVALENSDSVPAALEAEIGKEVVDIMIENSDSVPVALEPEIKKEETDIAAENSETVHAALELEIEKKAIDKEESVLEAEIEKKEIDKEESILVPEVKDDTGNQENLLKAEVDMEAMDDQESLIEEFCDVSPPVVMEIENASTANAAVEISVAVADSMMPKLSKVVGEVSVEEVDLTYALGESHEFNLMENEHQCIVDVHSDSATEEDSFGNETEDGSDYESDDSRENEIAEETSEAFLAVSNSEVQSEEFAVAAHESTQTVDKSPLVAGSKVTVGMVSSPFAANSLQGLFPRPTVSTTPRKSSTKKPATSQKIPLAEINKENIDKSGRKVELKCNKAKKNAIDETLSLRQLTKMLRGQLEKIKIADDKNNEVENMAEVGTRTALQILPENRIVALEPEQKN